MSTFSLQRLPNGSHLANRHCRFIISVVPRTRHYTVQAGRSKPKTLVRSNANKLDKAIFAILRSHAEDPPLPSAEQTSRLFEPLPRRATSRHLHEKLQLHAQFLHDVIARQEGPRVVPQETVWEDINDFETRREMTIRRSRFVRKNPMQLLPKNHRNKAQPTKAVQSANVNLRSKLTQRVITSNRHRAKHEVAQAVASQRSVERTMATLQEMQMQLQAFEHQVQELTSKTDKPSLLQATVRTLKEAPEALLAQMSRLYQYMIKASDSAVQAARPTKKQMLVTAAAVFGFHVSGTLLKLLSSAWDFVPTLQEAFMLYPNLHDYLGLLVHTSSLPLLIAVAPRTRNVFRRSKQSNFHSYQRRSLSKTPSVPGPRKEAAFRDLMDNHPELLDKPFPMAAVLNDLRNLQALRGASSGREYKVAERRLFRAQHESELGEGGPLTVRQVAALLEPDDSVGWTTIRQRLLTDRVDAIDRLSREDRARVMFQRVYGIGATKAERFVQAGFLTLEQLREASLERAQRIGLTHLDDIECLIPRSESEQWRDTMLDVTRAVDAKLGLDLLGSFRRGDHYSSDLDFVVFHPLVVDLRLARADNPARSDPNPLAATLLNSIVDELRRRHLLADELLAHGPLAVKGLVRLSATSKARRIDLNFAPFARRAFYTLAKTGDADLMVHLRAKAKAKGWALNEYGIGPPNQNGSAWTTNLLPEAIEERQIFELLKVPYLEPQQRSFSIYASKLKISRP